VLVGSRHTGESLWAAMDDPGLPARTRLGPPGVDVRRFVPRDETAAREGLAALHDRLAAAAAPPVAPAPSASADPPAAPTSPVSAAPPLPTSAAPPPSASAAAPPPTSSFARQHGEAAAALETIRAGDRLVVFVGKLIGSKGVELLLAAWPLVLAREPAARLVVVGFGAFRGGLQALERQLAAGDLEAARATRDEAGRELPSLAAFLDSLEGDEAASYRAAAAGMPDRVAWAGRLDHDELADLLPAAEAMAVTSTFPEAFGMVAAEAAACGELDDLPEP
jgi:glycosyltransferase involved in cell wall biosynthesis